MLLGVLCISQVSDAYRPGLLDRWYYAALQKDVATAAGAWFVAVASLLLVPTAAGFARSIGPYAWPGAALVATAGVINAPTALLPFVVVTHLPHGETALGETLLGIALSVDGLFSLVLGCGLILISLGMARAVQYPMWLSGFGLVAGLLCVGAFGRAWSSTAADFSLLAGPVWCAWFATASVVLLRLPSFRGRELVSRRQETAEWIEPLAARLDPPLPIAAK